MGQGHWRRDLQLIYLFSFWSCTAVCGILAPWPGIKPSRPATEVRSLNHWIDREVSTTLKLMLADTLTAKCPLNDIWQRSRTRSRCNGWCALGRVFQVEGMAGAKALKWGLQVRLQGNEQVWRRLRTGLAQPEWGTWWGSSGKTGVFLPNLPFIWN